MANACDFRAGRINPDDSAAIDRFWRRFAEIAPALDGNFRGTAEPADVAGYLTVALGDLAEQITSWEFGAGENGGHHRALSPEPNHELRRLARAIVNRAPDLDGWNFPPPRHAISSNEPAVRYVVGGTRQTVTAASIIPSESAHRRIDFEGQGKGDLDMVNRRAGLMFSVLFGEAAERDWPGEVHARRANAPGVRLRRPPARKKRASEFVARTREILDHLKDQHPNQPLGTVFADGSASTLFEVKPGREADHPRADLVTCMTPLPDIAAARSGGARVSPVRCSRFGESLCGIRIERNEHHDLDLVDERAGITDLVHHALRDQGIGRITGEGHGLGPVCIDFATTDIPAAQACIETLSGDQDIVDPAGLLFEAAGLDDLALPLAIPRRRH